MKKKEFFLKKVLTLAEGYGIIIKSKKAIEKEKSTKAREKKLSKWY